LPTNATEASPEGWDLVLRPGAGWFDLHFSELWRYRDLVLLLVWRDFVARYKQTILGPLWHVIQPLLTTCVFTVFFGRIAGLPTDGVPPFLFYMSGTVLWGYFAACLANTSSTFISNAGIFGKVYFPRLCVPVAVVLSQLVSLAIQLTVFGLTYAFLALRGMPVHLGGSILLLPILVFIMAALGLGGGIIISSLTTRYRDLQQLVTFGVQLLMFAAPVVYPMSAVKGSYRWILLANPMTPVIESFRYAVMGVGLFQPMHLAYSGAMAVGILFLGTVLFHRVERTFMDTI
jgi:lipopolysaccharide transport system permease protein